MTVDAASVPAAVAILQSRFAALDSWRAISALSQGGSAPTSPASPASPAGDGTSAFSAALASASGATPSAGTAVDPTMMAVPSPSTGGVVAAQLAAASAGPVDTGGRAVQLAQSQIGVPYQWGGTSAATGYDCSGLVQNIYGRLGIPLPRTSQEQATAGVPVASLAEAQPGDLVFFEPGPTGPGHVGIYIGNGQMIDAPHTGASVRVEQVWGQPVAIRRVTGITPSGSLPPTSSSAPVAGQPFASEIDSASAATGVPAALLSGLLQTESGFNPTAISPAGAQGIAQLMPSTAASMGVDAFDPAQAIPAAARLVAGYHNQFGSWQLALAAYNAGPGAVESYGGIPPYPETQAYVARISGLAGLDGGTQP